MILKLLIQLLNDFLNRNKVDLTKYIEEHNFNFDNVFDDKADNNQVSNSKQIVFYHPSQKSFLDLQLTL